MLASHFSMEPKKLTKKESNLTTPPFLQKTTYILLLYIFCLNGLVIYDQSHRILSVSYTCHLYYCKGIEYIKNHVILSLPNTILSYKKNVTFTILDTIVPN